MILLFNSEMERKKMEFIQNLSDKTKKIAAGVIIGLIVLFVGVKIFSNPDSEKTSAHASDKDIDYKLADNIQDGVILHCFNWKYNDIKAELKNIAAAGFTSVQTSPAQIPVNSGLWYYLYQPMGFNIGTNDLGTKGELKELCDEAEKYGIKVIVDVVANHLADDPNIQSDLKETEYWHTMGEIVNRSDRYQVTHCSILMPDLNHENAYVQQVISNYITELKNIGVDGIRWDSAKHISLPSEGTTFWTAVASQGLYHYGDMANGPDDRETGNEDLMIEYTNYISVTDGTYGQYLRESLADGTVPVDFGNWSTRGVEKNKLVYWSENHDSWSNNQDFGFSNCMSQNTIDRAYAIAASQSGATALYFSRPQSSVKENIFAGRKGSTHFTSAEVSAVNHFHNDMIGQKDAYATENNCAVVGRELGAVIVAGSGGDFQVKVSNPDGLTRPGRYKDAITGATWIVTDTTISGTIGDTGIAVIYGESVAPITSGTQNEGDGSTDSNKAVVTEGTIYYNNTENWANVYAYYWSSQSEQLSVWPGVQMKKVEGNVYSIDLPAGSEYIIFNDGNALKTKDVSLAGAGKIYNNGKWSDYKKTDTQTTPEETTPTEPIPTTGAVFFKNSEKWSNVKAYYWSMADQKMCAWPGEDMILVDGDIYGIILPEGTEYIIFNNGDAAQTIDISLAGANKLYADEKWSDYSGTIADKKPDTSDSSVNYEGNVFFKNTMNWKEVYIYYWSTIDPKMTTWPGEKMNSLGDDIYGFTLPEGVESVIFTDGDGTQTDDLAYPGSNVICVGEKWVEMGSADLDQPEQPKEKQYVYFKNTGKWKKVCAYYWNDDNTKMTKWPGVEMEKVDGDVYRIEIPDDAKYIIFNNTVGDQSKDIPLEGLNKIFDGKTWSEFK